MTPEHVKLAVLDASGAEYVPARHVRDDEWRLIRSPLYATGVAAGDLIRVVDSDTGAFEVVARGGNLCVQFYLSADDADDVVKTESVAAVLAAKIRSLGGREDARTAGLITFTIPFDAGFGPVEKAFAEMLDEYPGAQWQFSNVYDPDTGKPLYWWSTN